MVDDRALVETFADQSILVAARYLEAQRSPLHRDKLDIGGDGHADGCRGDMADVDMGAYGSLMAAQERTQCLDACPFDEADHEGGGENRRHVAETRKGRCHCRNRQGVVDPQGLNVAKAGL
ncbi:hypothetical protein [Mesorhizobium sp. WSM3868]|uniref:hypothetical protein n=1 Tax=Mesorhizobium sp. WSM3868 TaxID=2029405 RepID=UPI0015C960A5|nr:hypothetical protein [Mesorhizobium sp. WSM3868]